MNAPVAALAFDKSGNLYAGGGIWGGDIAKWDGSSWSALRSGMNNGFYSLTVDGSGNLAGGWFTTAGGTSASYIAKGDFPAVVAGNAGVS